MLAIGPDHRATMATVQEDGTAAAADQIGSMSLGDAVERTVGESETKNEDADTNETPTKKLCSKCGKESDTLKKCTACKCVWYCDKDCQNRHWKEHKKECRRIKKGLEKRGGNLDVGTEEDLGPLPDLPPREECPICMRALPLHGKLQFYAVCCGKSLCYGCDLQHEMKSGDGVRTCAFCRTAPPDSDEEMVARLRKRVDLNDPRAMNNLSPLYGFGQHGLPVDQARCIHLLRQSAGLGYPGAQFQLASYHRFGEMGLKEDQKEALKYLEKAAEGGDVLAWHNLGCIEANDNGNIVAAMRHFRMSASGGYRTSMECFEKGFLQHRDLAEILQAMYLARDEMRSKDRDDFIKHLKMTGEYQAEYEL